MSLLTARATSLELNEMRSARVELGRADSYLSTEAAAATCCLDVSAETLLDYPNWALPRVPKNPQAKRITWLFDPRDLQALPTVLRLWHEAIESGTEEEFKQERIAALRQRDEVALARAYGRAA